MRVENFVGKCDWLRRISRRAINGECAAYLHNAKQAIRCQKQAEMELCIGIAIRQEGDIDYRNGRTVRLIERMGNNVRARILDGNRGSIWPRIRDAWDDGWRAWK